METSVFYLHRVMGRIVIYRLLKPLYAMPLAAREWHTTISSLVEGEGYMVSHHLRPQDSLGAHIDHFVITCANQPVLDRHVC